MNLWLGRRGEGIAREFGVDMYTVLFKMDNQQETPEWHMGLHSVLRASVDGRGVWGRMDACIRMAESLCCSPETTQHCLLISYTPI